MQNNFQKTHKKNLFGSIHFYRYSLWMFILSIICIFLIFAQTIYLGIRPSGGGFGTIWFSSWGYFTQQTNLICFGASIIYFLWLKTKKINYDSFFASAMTYITITFFVYNFVLVPVNAMSSVTDAAAFSPLVETLKTMMSYILHDVVPISFLAFYILYIIFEKRSRFDVKKFVGYSLIYPFFYLVYVITVPFISDGYVNYLNTCQAYNPGPNNLSLGEILFPNGYLSVYDVVTDFRGSTAIACAACSALVLVFSCLSYSYNSLMLEKELRFLFFKKISKKRK